MKETTITFTEDEVIDICFALNDLVNWEAKKIADNMPIEGCTHSEATRIRQQRLHDFTETLINTRNKLRKETQDRMIY